ncbi:MAG: hypothetical protein GY702_03275 [Desulfobulbaceae bacterium]|nr:hypothetical protein [Desulfobulbaceae bacterium]
MRYVGKDWNLQGSFFRNVSFILIILLFCPGLVRSSSVTLEQIKLNQFPEEWIITSEFIVTEDKVAQFERRFAASIDTIFNQLIAVKDDAQSRVQINYVVCHTEMDAIFTLKQMVEMVGQRNTILRRENAVIEVIATNSELKQGVVNMIDVSVLQKRKITNTTLPESWKFVREIAMNNDELQAFSQNMMVTVDEVVNQFFLIDRERAQINYIGCNSEGDADKVYNRLNELTGKVNTILKKETIVVEIILTTPRSLDEVLKRFENF